MLLSAQDSPQGVPKELLEAKKLELIQEKVIALVLQTSIQFANHWSRWMRTVQLTTADNDAKNPIVVIEAWAMSETTETQ